MTDRPVLSLSARHAVRALTSSQIREVANAGMDDPGILPFWFGEPDEVTPAFIRAAAIDAIERGDTFYTQNHGIPELREAVAKYLTWLHRPTAPGEVAVTASGMSALMLCVQALVDPGDRVAVVTPVWPNLTEIPKVLGAHVARVPLAYGPRGWTLDLDRLLAALTPDTRLLLINSPNNPTGWTIAAAEAQAILAHCRRHGIWILADDVYERLHYAAGGRRAGCAPSFLDIAGAEDRVISTNSFSKSWLMTGFRLGWIVAPTAMAPDLGKLVEYNTSCSPCFVQRAGVVAIRDGEATVAHTRQRFAAARDLLVQELNRIPGVDAIAPPGAMYAFFRIDGMTNSLGVCKRLVREAKLGLAPGSAFGPEGEGFVRWCFAATDARLADGVARLSRFLARERRSVA
jgi:aspartate/methionine/tyrosine aminotransferase